MSEITAVRLLGPVVLAGPDGPVALPGAVQKTIMARLALSPGETVSRDELIDALWAPDHPPSAAGTLRSHITRLRTRFRKGGVDESIGTNGQGYLLEVDPDVVDMICFEKSVARGMRGGDAEATVRAMHAALGRWHGRPLLGCRDSDWVRGEVDRLEEMRGSAIEHALRARLELGERESLVPDIEEHLARLPFRERLWETLMLALCRSGRRADALAAYRRARKIFAEELGLEPGAALMRLEAAILNDDPPADPAPPAGGGTAVAPAPAGNLPAETTGIIGRREEIAEVKRLLERARLVTLTGVGGVGKSRLALRIGKEVAGAFPDGVWLVELSELREPALLSHVLAESLDVQAQGSAQVIDLVADHLRDMRALVILDGCEHLLEPCAAVVDRLLRASSDLRVLATSRQTLAVPGEHVLPIPPLPLPGEGTRTAEAVTLFAERAAAVAVGPRGEREHRLVAEICRRLDGIPLAIELAAVRLRAMSPEELLRRLESRLGLLTKGPRAAPPRHQTMRATIDWSFGLCTPEERSLWAQLSIFPGGFDLASAEAVCVLDDFPGRDVLSVLDGLVDKSVLGREGHPDCVRFRMLGILREYGGEQLRRTGLEAALARRFREHYLRLTRRAIGEWFGPRQVHWFSWLRREYPNLRTALELFLAPPRDVHGALEFVNALHLLWIGSDFVAEGTHWLRKVLALADESTPARAHALWIAGRVLCLHGDIPGGAAMLRESAAVARSLNDDLAMTCATHVQGTRALMVGDIDEAKRWLERARAMHGAHGESTMLSEMVDVHLAMAQVLEGEPARALDFCRQVLTRCTESDEHWVRSYAYYVLACAELELGNPEGALSHAREAVEIKVVFRDQVGLAMVFDVLACVAAELDDARRAAFFAGAAQQYWNTLGTPWFGASSPWRRFRDRAEARARHRLTAGDFDAAFRAGLTGSPGEAVEAAKGIACGRAGG